MTVRGAQVWAPADQTRWDLWVGNWPFRLVRRTGLLTISPPHCDCGRGAWRPGPTVAGLALCGTCGLPYGYSAMGQRANGPEGLAFLETCCEALGLNTLEASLVANELQALALELAAA